MIMIVLEIAISLYKLVQGQWTKRLAIGNALLQIVGTIVFIIIVVNPVSYLPMDLLRLWQMCSLFLRKNLKSG